MVEEWEGVAKPMALWLQIHGVMSKKTGMQKVAKKPSNHEKGGLPRVATMVMAPTPSVATTKAKPWWWLSRHVSISSFDAPCYIVFTHGIWHGLTMLGIFGLL